MSFDGGKVGGKHILVGMISDENNYAAWTPPSVLDKAAQMNLILRP